MRSHISSMLVDTNVWIDYYLGYREGSNAARELLRMANDADVTLLHAVTTTKDVFFLVEMDYKREARRQNAGALSKQAAKAARQTAWGCVSNLQEVSTAVGCDQSDVWLAQKQRRLHGDYEDDLIVAAAMRSQASLLVTNDQELLRHCPVAALSVEDALRLLSD